MENERLAVEQQDASGSKSHVDVMLPEQESKTVKSNTNGCLALHEHHCICVSLLRNEGIRISVVPINTSAHAG